MLDTQVSHLVIVNLVEIRHFCGARGNNMGIKLEIGLVRTQKVFEKFLFLKYILLICDEKFNLVHQYNMLTIIPIVFRSAIG